MKKIFSLLAACMMLILPGCTPDEVELGPKDINVGDLVEGFLPIVAVIGHPCLGVAGTPGQHIPHLAGNEIGALQP